jgi:phage-related protein
MQPLSPLLADLAVKFINDVLPAILPILPELTKLSLEIAKVGLVLAQLVVQVAPYIERIIAIFQYLYDRLVGNSIIPDLINGMTSWFRNGVQWIQGIVAWFGQLPGMIGAWLGQVVTSVQAKWNEIRSAIGSKVDEIRNKISDVLGSISARWNEAWTSVRNFVGTAWNNIRNAVGDGINNVLNVIRGMPGQITGALGTLGGLLYNSGRSIIQGLIDGLYSMLQNAYNAAQDILNRIRALFPFSPAKEGPFSGRGWTLFSGQSMMAGLAEGIGQQEGLVTAALDDVLKAGAATLGTSLQVPALAAAAGPSAAPAFTSSFGAPAAASAGAGQASRSLVVENFNVTVQGVIDPSRPDAWRHVLVQVREGLRDLEMEAYPG